MNISGLHHVTAIASDPQRTLDFYNGTLGLRLVKRTVNFDDSGSYHFYFGDRVGSPGTILTFFPWPHARRGTRGTGEVESVAFTIPQSSTGWWRNHLTNMEVRIENLRDRFGEEVLRFQDPDGMMVELIASPTPALFEAWPEGPISPEHAIRGLHSVTLTVDAPDRTAELLIGVLGYQRNAGEDGRVRLISADPLAPGAAVDLVAAVGRGPGRPGAGSVHHVAFRVPSEDVQRELRGRLARQGSVVSSVMDRTYFHSIYFREPNGVLFEIATDGPGFVIDENVTELGMNLRLPSWMESSRERIEASLPRIQFSRSVTP